MTFLVILLALMQAADGWTTYRAITRGIGHERNRLVRALVERVGVYWALVILKGWAAVAILGAHAMGWLRGDLVGLMLLVLTIFYAAIVMNNFRVLRGS